LVVRAVTIRLLKQGANRKGSLYFVAIWWFVFFYFLVYFLHNNKVIVFVVLWVVKTLLHAGAYPLWFDDALDAGGSERIRPECASGSAKQGQATAISGDGRTACIGGANDNKGIGAMWMWTLSKPLDYSSWAQQGSKIVPNDNKGKAWFGYTCSLSFDGSIAVVGGDNDKIGATWVFTRNVTGWHQQGSKYIGTPYADSCGEYYYDTPVGQGGSVSIASVAANTFVTGGWCVLDFHSIRRWMGAERREDGGLWWE
jgi:hypothetical protein